jgi:hypothetical protein
LIKIPAAQEGPARTSAVNGRLEESGHLMGGSHAWVDLQGNRYLIASNNLLALFGFDPRGCLREVPFKLSARYPVWRRNYTVSI